jgi:hypothetical protein
MPRAMQRTRGCRKTHILLRLTLVGKVVLLAASAWGEGKGTAWMPMDGHDQLNTVPLICRRVATLT